MSLPSRKKLSRANSWIGILCPRPSIFLCMTQLAPQTCGKYSMLTLEYLAELLQKNQAAAKARVKEFSIGGRPFEFNSRPGIMGVINLSPDSWYRESVCLNT